MGKRTSEQWIECFKSHPLTATLARHQMMDLARALEGSDPTLDTDEEVQLCMCPFCLKWGPDAFFVENDKAKAQVVTDYEVGHWVVCRHCLTRGPIKRSHDDAVRAWNDRELPELTGVEDVATEELYYISSGDIISERILWIVKGNQICSSDLAGASVFTLDEAMAYLQDENGWRYWKIFPKKYVDQQCGRVVLSSNFDDSMAIEAEHRDVVKGDETEDDIEEPLSRKYKQLKHDYQALQNQEMLKSKDLRRYGALDLSEFETHLMETVSQCIPDEGVERHLKRQLDLVHKLQSKYKRGGDDERTRTT